MATIGQNIYRSLPNAVKNLLPPNWGLPPDRMSEEQTKHNLAGYVAPVQLQRIRQDIQTWREAVVEAENAWYPQRVKMQRLYLDTILNGHVTACMERRRDLTLLRDYALFTDGKENEKETELINQTWFRKFMSHVLDAQAFGYSLIALGDIERDRFDNLQLIKRQNVSPDRLNVTHFTYSITGAQFLEEPYKDWHIYASTVNETAMSKCGYGYLYKCAVYEILNRNLLGYNGDFVEMFAQPYRVGKTMKTEGREREALENALQNMGSAGWAVIDPTDDIQFLETALGGSGYKSYESLELRNNAHISKIILGHEDAMKSTPGKLGSDQGGGDSALATALQAKQSVDGAMIEVIVNEQLLPRMRSFGFNISENTRFAFKNDAEMNRIRENEDETNRKTAEIAQIMNNAGLVMDAKYFEERTGIPTTAKPAQGPMPIMNKGAKIEKAINKIYLK